MADTEPLRPPDEIFTIFLTLLHTKVTNTKFDESSSNIEDFYFNGLKKAKKSPIMKKVNSHPRPERSYIPNLR